MKLCVEIERGLARRRAALAHLPPEEHAQPRELVLEGGEGWPLGLESLASLELVRFDTWDRPDLARLGELPALHSVGLAYCSVEDLSPLSTLPRLVRVDVPGGAVRDVGPLLELPNLRHATLGGNPLDDASWYDLVPALRARGVREHPDYRLHEREWRLTRRFFDSGRRICAMRDIDGGIRLLVPGRGATLGRVVFLSDPEVVEEVLAAEPDLDTWGLMTRLRQRRWEERGRKGRPPGPLLPPQPGSP